MSESVQINGIVLILKMLAIPGLNCCSKFKMTKASESGTERILCDPALLFKLSETKHFINRWHKRTRLCSTYHIGRNHVSVPLWLKWSFLTPNSSLKRSLYVIRYFCFRRAFSDRGAASPGTMAGTELHHRVGPHQPSGTSTLSYKASLNCPFYVPELTPKDTSTDSKGIMTVP